jgi:hypothetical protein
MMARSQSVYSLTKGTFAAATVTAALGFAALAPAANALPVFIGFSTNGGATITDFPASGSDGTVAVSSFTTDGFTINLSATGTPPLSQPNFGSNTLTVNSTTAASIILYASETGITTKPSAFTSGFSNNPLSDTTVTESAWAGLNTKYSLVDLLGTATLAPGATASVTTALPAGLPDTYSVTETYAITFGAGGGAVNATILEIGRTAVPEPMSLALLGTALVGMAVIRRRKRV